jgi:hypothetical protein
MATPKVYVICDQNCKFEGMTKEQIHAAIMQAVTTGRIADVDAGFVTKVKTINGKYIKFFIGEQAAYDALSDAEKRDDLFAIITNDQNKAGLFEIIKTLEEWKKEVSDGEAYVQNAKSADTAKNIEANMKQFVKATKDGLSVTLDLNRVHVITAQPEGTSGTRLISFVLMPTTGHFTASTVSDDGFYCCYTAARLLYFLGPSGNVEASKVFIRSI